MYVARGHVTTTIVGVLIAAGSSVMSRADLSISEARRITLAAQGFDRPRRAGRITARQVHQTVRRLGLVQYDSVNVLAQAHYQVLFSRLGPYPLACLDELIAQGKLTEHWAHEASILPVDVWPLLRHRMAVHRPRPWGFESFLHQHASYVEWVLQQVRERGPLSADELPEPEGVARRLEHDWYRSVPRSVLEAFMGRGTLAVCGRRWNMARIYDLAERVIPVEHLEKVMEKPEAQRELLRRSARSHGIGTAADLADYYRMPVSEARPRLQELADAGELQVVRVEGWREPAYLDPQAKVPRKVEARALLSPFDPVVWFRPRAERLFDFEYRIEIYTPEKKRRWGYYVLPFLLGERLVARVDLKADRAAECLLVMGAHLEAGADAGETAAALAAELWLVAEWLRLDAVKVVRRSGFGRTLAAALRVG